MAEEAKDPGRDVPKAVEPGAPRGARRVRRDLRRRAVGAAGDRARRQLLAPRWAPPTRTTPCWGSSTSSASPAACCRACAPTSAILAATILFIATNAGLIGVSRLSWSLSEHRQLPGLFARLHPRYRTPWFTIAFFSVLAVLLLLPGRDRLPRQPLLVRGDALVHHGPRRGGGTAVQAARSATPIQGALERARARKRGPADRGARRARHVRRVRLGPRPARGGAHGRRRLDGRRAWPATSSTAARQGLDPRATRSSARSARPTSRRWATRPAIVPLFGTDL